MTEKGYCFGSGERVRLVKKPDACQTCNTSGVRLSVQEAPGGLSRWICWECKCRYRSYMMKYYLRAWSWRDAIEGGCLYRQKIYDSDAVQIAESGVVYANG